MAPTVRLGVIGSGRHALDLAEQYPWGAPFVGRSLEVTRCAAARTGGHAATEVVARTGARLLDTWQAVVADTEVDALLVLAPIEERFAMLEAAIAAAKPVLCPTPVVASSPELEALLAVAEMQERPPVILAGGALAHTPAGSTALGIVGQGSLGPLRSVYAGIHRGVGDDRGTPGLQGLDDTGWDVLDLVLRLVDSPVARVFAHGGSLFGTGPVPDTVVAIIRFSGGPVLTLEVSGCLPDTRGTTAQPEVELELIGSEETLRLEPYDTSVSVVSSRAPGGIVRRPWIAPPICGLLEGLVASREEPGTTGQGLARQRRLVGLGEAIRRAFDSGKAVEMGQT